MGAVFLIQVATPGGGALASRQGATVDWLFLPGPPWVVLMDPVAADLGHCPQEVEHAFSATMLPNTYCWGKRSC